MGSFSLVHWIIVLLVVLLFFGPKRLPDLARGVGEAIREFKKAVNSPDNQKSLGNSDQSGPQKNLNSADATTTHKTASGDSESTLKSESKSDHHS
jgi:sec-independent protein translocase protein TatA